MGERALERLKFMLIWELPIGIYEGFMKVICSLLLAEKSYSYLKIEKIEKVIKISWKL